jgi:hypothetical protein
VYRLLKRLYQHALSNTIEVGKLWRFTTLSKNTTLAAEKGCFNGRKCAYLVYLSNITEVTS